MKKFNRCENCGYCWQAEDDLRPCCHYEGPEDWCPCNQDEEPVQSSISWDDLYGAEEE